MPTARLSTKGQTVIPKQVREHLGLHTGDRIEFLIKDDGRVDVRAAVKSARRLAGILHKQGRKAVSVEDMHRAVREQASRRI